MNSWVLILSIWMYHASSTVTETFNSQQACEQAGIKSKNTFKSEQEHWQDSEVKYVCVSKGISQ